MSEPTLPQENSAATGNKSGAGPIRLLIADDETLFRDALATLLDLRDDLNVVAQAASGPEAVAMACAHAPDVALLDLQMPGQDGIQTATALATQMPGVACLIVTSHGRPGYLRRALEAGVRGFLPKTASAESLARAVHAAHRGERYVDPQLAADAIAAGASPLSPREADVLELAAQGAGIEEIARRMSLSNGTVRNYLSAATAKIGATDRREAARIAADNGWI